MFQSPPREKEVTSWLLAVLWASVIFCTVPFARTIQHWFDVHCGGGSLRWISIAIIAAAAVFTVLRLVRRLRELPWIRVVIVLAVAAVFIFLSLKLMKTPSEAVHFIEYGLLGLLIFRAFSHRQRDILIYLNVTLAGALVSTTDEILQWLTPGRYWDPRDLEHNALAIALVQVALAAGFLPPFINRHVQRSSVRMLTALIAAQALMLGFCASNTPFAAARISDRVPALAFLLDNDHAMSEYGWRHEDPDIGRFYSRFNRDDLQWIDHKRGAEVGAILDRYSQVDTYTNFLRIYTPARDPFTHEAMVHLFRRNHYFAVLPKHRFEPEGYRIHVTVAYRENQILERYFSNTLAHAGQQWTPELKEALQPFVRTERRYTSEVSRDLIHRISERGIWLIILGILVVDGLVYWRWGIPRRPPLIGPVQHSVPRDWFPVVLWTALIYGAIPLARTIQHWVVDQWSGAAFSWIVYSCIAAGCLLSIFYLRRQPIPMTRRQWAVLAALVALFSFGTWHLRANAEEALHLVEYGVLSLLIFRAYSRRYPDRGAYVASFLLGAFLGMIDEVIQWAVPRRFFDFRDIWINVGAVLLIQLGLAAGLAPYLCDRPASVRSARTAWRQARLILLLLLACVSNSPELWRPFYSYRPNLFVFDEMMVEYGHRHHDPAVGSFNSRLTLEQLRSDDELRAEEIASMMRRRGRDDNYETFLRRYSPITDPFAHEMRVRLFRRDHYWKEAKKNRDDPQKYAELIAISFGEQRLLENWFGNSLRASKRDWPTALRARAEEAALSGPYHSPVSRELITWCTRRQAQAVVAALVLVTLLVGRYDVKRRKRRARVFATL